MYHTGTCHSRHSSCSKSALQMSENWSWWFAACITNTNAQLVKKSTWDNIYYMTPDTAPNHDKIAGRVISTNAEYRNCSLFIPRRDMLHNCIHIRLHINTMFLCHHGITTSDLRQSVNPNNRHLRLATCIPWETSTGLNFSKPYWINITLTVEMVSFQLLEGIDCNTDVT